jgi:hypothetical protein
VFGLWQFLFGCVMMTLKVLINAVGEEAASVLADRDVVADDHLGGCRRWYDGQGDGGGLL